MRLSRPIGAALVGAALFTSACTPDIVEPDSTMSPSFSVAEGFDGEAPLASNHFVVFNRGVPRGFADEVAAVGGQVESIHEDLGVAVVSGLDDVDARALKRATRAQHVELEPMIMMDEPAGGPDVLALEGDMSSSDDPSAAPWYPAQWNMRAIQADAAWAAGRLGESTTTVAILDTGIDYGYPDLVGRVDLSKSISFLPMDDLYASIYFPGRHPITDLHYHGTHVASTVASNGNVFAGVTSGVTLVGIKVCSVFGGCPGSAIFAGVAHAIAIEADVANMSLGGSFTKSDYPGFVSAVQRLFNAANRAGVTMVVAAGNDGADMDHDGNGFRTYCNAANVICVSATGPTSGGTFTAGPFPNPDAFAGYSNFGRSAISIAAPGGNAPGVVAACSQTSLVIPVCGTGTYVLGLGGTSMASPHAAGVAALISEDVGRNPGLIRQRLHQSADDLGQPGTDPYYGKGRINAGAAVGAN